MKNVFDETTKLSMADGDDDYDEYEEEVVERDEEYDPEDDEDEYEDEEYDDEDEGEDEDYDDEDEYDDEEYEEEPPYDDYYDDRLNKVLDELAELKRSIAAPAPVVQQAPPYPSVQPHVLFSVPTQQNSNEVVMYNEISRLRDELAKTQNDQSMHVELSRLKEEMERDKRHSDEQFLAEIRRLNERIEELQGGAPEKPRLPNSAPPAGGYLDAPRAPAKELNKLISVNESILHSMSDSDAKILGEIDALKKQLDALKTDEIAEIMTEIRAEVASLESSRDAEASEQVKTLLAEISEHIEALKASLGEEITASQQSVSQSIEGMAQSVQESLHAIPDTNAGGSGLDRGLVAKLSRLGEANASVDLTEVMRAVYELKGMLGSNDSTQQSLVNMALKAYTELDLLHVTVANATDFRSKLDAIDHFVDTVNEQDFITSDALSAFKLVVREVLHTPLTRKIFDSICSYAATNARIVLGSARKETISRYIGFAEQAQGDNLEQAIEILPDLISALNDVEDGKNLVGNNGIGDSIVGLNAERLAAPSETAAHAAETEIKALLKELTSLYLDDVVKYTPTMPLPTSDAVHFEDGDSVSDRLNTLVQIVGDLSLSMPAEAHTEGEAGNAVATDLEELKQSLAALEAKVNLDEVYARLSRHEATMSERLSAIEQALAARPAASAQTSVDATVYDDTAPVYAEPTAEDIADEVSARIDIPPQADLSEVLQELAEIKDKLAEHDAILAQIEDLRNDIAAMTTAAPTDTATDAGADDGGLDKLYEDLTAQVAAQCDKLYEDLTAVEGEASDALRDKVEEVKAAIDALPSADLMSTLLDTVIDFKTEFADSRALSEADRTKILEDLAFVREQVQQRLDMQSESAVDNESLAAQIAETKEEFLRNISALEASIAELKDGIALTSAQENGSEQIEQQLSEVGATLAELKDRSAALEAAIEAASATASENHAAVTGDLGAILEQLTPPQTEAEAGSNVYDEIVAISDKVDELDAAYREANGNLLTALADLKEQIHLKETEQIIEAGTASEEERASLAKEIAALRERLADIESKQDTQADEIATQLGLVADQVSTLCEQPTGDTEAIRAAVEQLDTHVSEHMADGTVAENMEILLAGVADVKTLLESVEQKFDGEASAEFAKMQEDLAFVRSQIEANMDGFAEDDTINTSLQDEDMSLLMDDVAAIKDKLAALEEYDTVSEILSLREDVKAARLLDSSDVASELEALKSDLLDLKADISDLKTAHTDTETTGSAATPTGDEVNMILGEIVSLREEVQDYKDEVLHRFEGAEAQEAEPTIAVADENATLILQELAGLHAEVSEWKEEKLSEHTAEIEDIKNSLAELKDIISRRTSIAAEDGAENAGSNELNVVLDEIIDIKDEVAALKDSITQADEAETAARESDVLSAKSMFTDELQVFKNELYSMVSRKLEELSAVTGGEAPGLLDELQNIRDSIEALASSDVSGATDTSDAVSADLADIKALLAEHTEAPAAQSEEIASLHAEIAALRDEIKQMHTADATPTVSADMQGVESELQAMREELRLVRGQIGAHTGSGYDSSNDEAVLGEVLAMRNEIAQLHEQIAQPVETKADETLLGEVLALKEEIAQLREQAEKPAAQADEAVLGEILALREELQAARSGGDSDLVAGLMESVDAMREDIRAIKEEPDLSYINEVLALRDEFQAFKDELNKTRTAPAEDKGQERLMAEVQSLRDQIFAISMASVNDGTSGEDVYESYNNIILDEINALRDEVASLRKRDTTSDLGDEIADMKDRLTNLAVDDREHTEAQLEEIRSQIADLRRAPSENANDAVMAEIAALKAAIDGRAAADETTFDFLSELSRLLEQQSAPKDDGDLRAEIESLREEIAASRTAPAVSTDALLGELEDLRNAIAGSASAPAVIDNGAVLEEIEALRTDLLGVTVDNSAVLDELSSLRADIRAAAGGTTPADIGAVLAELAAIKKALPKGSDGDGKKILREISRLKADIEAIVAKPSGDGALAQSINDLKQELNQIAGYVEEDETPATPAQPAAKPRGKGGRKKAPRAASVSQDELSAEDILSKINATDVGTLTPPSDVPQTYAPTAEEMEVAARLAKQVANKLIMEQLVEQLGDGDVPHSEVEEIVRDILPQEFTTIQIDEQTDKVRRLANSLVLDKLRNRLKK